MDIDKLIASLVAVHQKRFNGAPATSKQRQAARMAMCSILGSDDKSARYNAYQKMFKLEETPKNSKFMSMAQATVVITMSKHHIKTELTEYIRGVNLEQSI